MDVDVIQRTVYDVCVIGTGPAGTPLALELHRLKPEWKILLLEFGVEGEAQNELDDSVKIETPLNHHEPYECTNKLFGGTSLTWGGRCVSYDEIDFLQRPILANECTWDPSIFAEVKAFYPQAAEYLECGQPVFTTDELPVFARKHITPKLEVGAFTDSVVERWSMPTRLGAKYKTLLTNHPQIDLAEGICADQIDAEAGHITQVDCIDRKSGRRFSARAKSYVVAAGAQESTRLLLKSNTIFEKRGGAPASLGAYYQGHISGKIASVKFSGNPKETEFGFLLDGDIYIRRRFQMATDALLREDLLNTAIWLDNPLYYDPSHRNGTMSFIYLMMVLPVIGKRLAPPAISHSVTKGRVNQVGQHLRNILLGFPRSFYEPFRIFVGRYLSKRKLPGVFLYSPRNEYALHFHGEQLPKIENRMALGEDGQTLHISYTYADADIDSVIRTHELLDAWLRKSGAGELVYWYPQAELGAHIRSQSKDGIHQNGTTRMSLKPEDGVVDRDLKVWGTDNLYVCSSSTFPTSGQANPTFLLTAFAARLAAHLANQ